MTRIDRNMQVGEALFILGHQDLSDVDTLMRAIFKKAEKWDHVVAQSSKDFVHVTETLRKLKAIRTYLNELGDTGNFVDRQKIKNILEGKA